MGRLHVAGCERDSGRVQARASHPESRHRRGSDGGGRHRAGRSRPTRSGLCIRSIPAPRSVRVPAAAGRAAGDPVQARRRRSIRRCPLRRLRRQSRSRPAQRRPPRPLGLRPPHRPRPRRRNRRRQRQRSLHRRPQQLPGRARRRVAAARARRRFRRVEWNCAISRPGRCSPGRRSAPLPSRRHQPTYSSAAARRKARVEIPAVVAERRARPVAVRRRAVAQQRPPRRVRAGST